MPTFPDKTSKFIDWYLEVLDAAELTDKRYPVKGMNVWTPYGFQARRQLDAVMIREIEKTRSVPVEFPTLIPQTEFQKEKEHIKGFDAQVYWVTKGGATDLDVPLVLRPTSETAMYPVFALWIRSHKDLPLNVYQIVNTFRYETKTTRPFLRVREIHFFEEHTCQVDEAAATARVGSNLSAFGAMAEAFVLPFVAIRRPEWDKFPGAFYSIALDIPVGGARTLQIGSIHHYRENFSGPYGIHYEAPDGSSKLVHQTTFGLSERLVGAVVSVHGDAKGVVFPSSLAPYQIVVVPILSGDGAAGVADYAARLAERLLARGLRVHVDDSEERPGAKYYRWETHGVPVRLEIGRREAAQGTVTVADRLGEKRSVGPENLDDAIVGALADYDRRLREKAHAAFASSFSVAHRLDELKDSTTVRLLAWCGTEACGHRVEEAIDGALLGTPEGPLPIDPGAPGGCIGCGAANSRWALAGQPL
ncbi:MAG: proline--tRNA ligase [Thermoplasmata archaeon]|nr:proline--tRNA ligase [Thermoplasmata archaeon]MCI4361818.1 proline--tRNA ligase [Thermoplasmata archaeon]